MSFNLIAAVTADQWGIGYKGNLPWARFPEDMRLFREYTTNGIVIMGRKTWHSMNNRPLKDRTNIVVSRTLAEANQAGTRKRPANTESQTIDPVFFRSSFPEALILANSLIINNPRQIWIIGGSSLYQEALNHPDCGQIYIGQVSPVNSNEWSYLKTDNYFPKLSSDRFKLVDRILSVQTGLELNSSDTLASEHSPIHLPVHYQLFQFEPINNQPRIQSHRGPMYFYLNESGYLQALSDILRFGSVRSDRTEVGTRSLFGLHFRYDLTRGFPLFTSKRTFWKGIVAELLWFLSGKTDTNILKAQGVNFWNGNSSREFLDKRGLTNYAEGDIGPSYSFMFRHQGAHYYGADWDYTGEGFDQVKYVIQQIRENPMGRRAIINLWQANITDKMALPPCLYSYQFYVAQQTISCIITQRSGDSILGVPFNVASASLLTYMIGHICNLQPLTLIHNIADAHIYSNHVSAAEEQITRPATVWPKLNISCRLQTKIEDFQASDFELLGYWPAGPIKAEMAV